MPLRFLPFILLVAAAPDPWLKSLERSVVCPETLPDDAARIAAVRHFVERYGAIHPGSRMGERLAARERLLGRLRCQPETLQHSFPEQ